MVDSAARIGRNSNSNRFVIVDKLESHSVVVLVLADEPVSIFVSD